MFKLMLTKYVGILLWFPLAFIYGALLLLGLVLVPVGLLISKGMAANWPRLLWLWGNDEDGFGPKWWFDRIDRLKPEQADSKIKRALYTVQKKFPRWWWLAIRNPVNNHRFLFTDPEQHGFAGNWSDDLPMEAPQILEKNQRSAYMYKWSGWKSGYRRVWLNDNFLYSEMWVGFKIGSDVPGCGFTLQYRRKRDIGK